MTALHDDDVYELPVMGISLGLHIADNRESMQSLRACLRAGPR